MATAPFLKLGFGFSNEYLLKHGSFFVKPTLRADGFPLFPPVSEAMAYRGGMDDPPTPPHSASPDEKSLDTSQLGDSKATWVSGEQRLKWDGSPVASYNPESKMFRCCKCGAVGFLSRIAEHYLGTHTEAKVFQCLHCPYSSTWSRCVRMHMAKHHGVPNAPPSLWKGQPLLEEIFQLLTDLKTRVDSQTQPPRDPSAPEVCDKKFVCPKCPYTTDRRDLYMRHENIHKEDKPYHCYVCFKLFNRADHVKKHFLRIHRGHPYDISLVRRRGNRASHLPSADQTTGNGPPAKISNFTVDKLISCEGVKKEEDEDEEGEVIDLSSKRTPSPNEAKNLLKTFRCPQCEWEGVDGWCLRRHLATHARPPFPCPLCSDFAAPRPDALFAHAYEKHRKLLCTKCHFATETSADFEAHVKECSLEVVAGSLFEKTSEDSPADSDGPSPDQLKFESRSNGSSGPTRGPLTPYVPPCDLKMSNGSLSAPNGTGNDGPMRFYDVSKEKPSKVDPLDVSYDAMKMINGSLKLYDSSKTMNGAFDASKMMNGSGRPYDISKMINGSLSQFDVSKVMNGSLGSFDVNKMMNGSIRPFDKIINPVNGSMKAFDPNKLLNTLPCDFKNSISFMPLHNSISFCYPGGPYFANGHPVNAVKEPLSEQFRNRNRIERCKVDIKPELSSPLQSSSDSGVTDVSCDRDVTCGSCGCEFADPDSLRTHTQLHHSASTSTSSGPSKRRRDFACAVCGFASDRQRAIIQHMRLHNGEMVRCRACVYSTTLDSTLEDHVTREHSDGTLRCPHCGLTCGQVGAFVAHYRNCHHPRACQRCRCLKRSLRPNKEKVSDSLLANSLPSMVRPYLHHNPYAKKVNVVTPYAHCSAAMSKVAVAIPQCLQDPTTPTDLKVLNVLENSRPQDLKVYEDSGNEDSKPLDLDSSRKSSRKQSSPRKLLKTNPRKRSTKNRRDHQASKIGQFKHLPPKTSRQYHRSLKSYKLNHQVPNTIRPDGRLKTCRLNHQPVSFKNSVNYTRHLFWSHLRAKHCCRKCKKSFLYAYRVLLHSRKVHEL